MSALADLELAIARNEARIGELIEQWREAGGLCCPGCMYGYGSEYSNLEERLERQNAWRAVLLARADRCRST